MDQAWDGLEPSGGDTRAALKYQHLVDRTPVNPENPCRLSAAHTLDNNCVSYAPVKFTRFIPALCKSRKLTTGGFLLRLTTRQSGRFSGGLLHRRSHPALLRQPYGWALHRERPMDNLPQHTSGVFLRMGELNSCHKSLFYNTL